MPTAPSQVPRARPRNARPSDGEVEGGGLPGDLERVQRERVETDRPEADGVGGVGDLEQRRQRWLEHQVGVDADHVDAVRLGLARQRGVGAGALVALQPDAELAAGHVRSFVRKRRTPMRSTRIVSRSSGSGQANSTSRSSQSPAGSWRCLAARNGSTDASA